MKHVINFYQQNTPYTYKSKLFIPNNYLQCSSSGGRELPICLQRQEQVQNPLYLLTQVVHIKWPRDRQKDQSELRFIPTDRLRLRYFPLMFHVTR